MSESKSHDYKPTSKGYIRKSQGKGKPLRFEHDMVWEQYFGEIPEGYQIHHIDGDKTNNDIRNLILVSALDHKRIHEGCKYVLGEWYKPCSVCGKYKLCNEDNWYYSRGTINGTICKECYIKKQVENRRIRVAHGWKRKTKIDSPVILEGESC